MRSIMQTQSNAQQIAWLIGWFKFLLQWCSECLAHCILNTAELDHPCQPTFAIRFHVLYILPVTDLHNCNMIYIWALPSLKAHWNVGAKLHKSQLQDRFISTHTIAAAAKMLCHCQLIVCCKRAKHICCLMIMVVGVKAEQSFSQYVTLWVR